MEYNILKSLEIIAFIVFALYTLYIFIFAISSLFYKVVQFKESPFKKKTLVLIPAYKEDTVVIDSTLSVLNQEYPKEDYTVCVISDRMSNETNNRLLELGAEVLIFEPELSSKAKALNHAINKYKDNGFELVVILDADNIVEKTFLSSLNNAFGSGCRAIQAHRTAKNMDTDVALLDAISEEINNSIFRKGHVSLGISSALIGSAMAFEFEWFKNAVSKLATAGEDKELELLLLKEKVFIHYLENIFVLDEKTKKDNVYFNQRRRWLASQLYSLRLSIKSLPNALLTSNIGYIDKVLQWLLPPRIVLLGIILSFAVISSIFQSNIMLYWWLLFFFIFMSLGISLPIKMLRKISIKTLCKLPKIFILTILNFFRTKGAVKTFIHTPKN